MNQYKFSILVIYLNDIFFLNFQFFFFFVQKIEFIMFYAKC